MSTRYLTEDEIDAKIKAAISGGGSDYVKKTDTNLLVNGYFKATKGWVQLGPILINWGTLSIAKNNRGSTTFQKSFSGTPYSGVCTWDYDDIGGQENYAITSMTSSTIYITNGEGTQRLFRWIVIGPA